MSLSSSTLSTAMRAAFLADADIGAIDGDALTALCDAISTAVVDHITSDAVIGPGTFLTSSSPVTGVGTIT